MDGFQVTRWLSALFTRFRRSTSGAILVEALIVVPVVVVFAVGVAEFGSIFWQRHQLQAGVRDAARYMARCTEVPATASNCDPAIARNIAFFGTPTLTATTPHRVRGWYENGTLEFKTIEVKNSAGTKVDMLVQVTGRATYTGSGLIGLIGLAKVDFAYSHQERFIGW